MHKSSVSTVINFVADSFLIIQMLQRFAVSFKSTKSFPEGTLLMSFTHASLGVTPIPVSSHPAPTPSAQQPQARQGTTCRGAHPSPVQTDLPGRPQRTERGWGCPLAIPTATVFRGETSKTLIKNPVMCHGCCSAS